MRKKLLSCFAILGLAFGVLAGCANGDKSVELKTMSMFGGTDPLAETYEKFLREFETENSKDGQVVKINDSSATSDETWKTSVISSFYTGSEPDVLYFFTGATAKPLVTNKKVVSIEEIRKEYPNYAKNISESVLDPYAVTIKGFVEGIFVNKNLFTGDLATYIEKDKWSWDEFLEICAKLNTAGKTPMALGAIDVPHYWIEHLLLGINGSDAFTNIPSKADFENETATAKKWIDALALMKVLADANVFGESKGTQKHEVAEASFKKGDTAMILDGSWFANGFGTTTTDSVKVTSNDLMMMPFPAIPASLGGQNKYFMQSGFTSGFYISKKAWDNPEKRELAVKFVEKMTSTAAIKEYCKEGGTPADPSVVIDNLSNIGVSMNSMPARTQGSTLPLSDACKASTFPELVTASAAYLSGDKTIIKEALINFASKQ